MQSAVTTTHHGHDALEGGERDEEAEAREHLVLKWLERLAVRGSTQNQGLSLVSHQATMR
jgi:hypothetical protein